MIVSLILTAGFLLGYGFLLVKISPRAGIRLGVEADFSGGGICRLYIADQKPIKREIKNGKEFREIFFNLPKKELSHMRISLGNTCGTVIIREIKLKSLVNTKGWPGSTLIPLTGHSASRAKISSSGNLLTLEIKKGPVILPMGNEITSAANLMSQDLLPYVLAGLPLGVLIFFFCYYFSLQGWQIFINRKVMLSLVPVFAIIILAPLLIDILVLDKGKVGHALQEKRIKAEKPEFRLDSLHQFGTAYKPYYNDRFPFRNSWIYLNNFIKIRGFGVSPLDKVVLGKDDWLFMGRQNFETDETEYFRAIKPFTHEELEQWRVTLEQRRDWLNKRGIDYLFVMAPNKSTLYPQFMPSRFRKVGKQSRWDQLYAHLKEHSTVEVLDLREAMKKAGESYRVYRKGDTHWNQYGAFMAYRQIIQTLARYFPGLTPMPLEDFEISYKDRPGGDLAIMLFLQNRVFRENAVSLTPRRKLHSVRGKKIDFKHARVRQSVVICPKGELPTALLVHDSFTQRLKPYLSEHFSRIIYFRDWGMGFFPKVIKREKVKLVIDQTTERFLMSLKPKNPPVLRHP